MCRPSDVPNHVSEYRDPLETAHHRIEQLEREAKERDPAAGTPFPGQAFAVAFVIAIGMVGIGGFFALSIHTENMHATRAVTEAPPEPVAPPEHLVPAPWRVPSLVDVNGDGAADIVGVFTSAHDGMIRVAALDGKSFEPLWTIGPFPASLSDGMAVPWTSYVIASNRIAVTNGGDLVVYGLADGRFQTTFGGDPAPEICLASAAGIQRGKKSADGAFAIGEISAAPTEVLVARQAPHASLIVDVATGASRAPGNETWCYSTKTASGRGCLKKGDDDCARFADPPFATPGYRPYMMFEEKGRRISIGNDGGGEVLGFAAGDTKAAWQKSLVLDGDGHFEGYMVHAIDDGRFFSVYSVGSRGDARVAARSVATGEELWRAVLHTDADSYPVAIGADQGRVLVLTRARTLNVLDAATGKVLAHFGQPAATEH